MKALHFAALAGVMTAASVAHAANLSRQHVFHGTTCRAANGADSASLAYGQYGVHNLSSSPVTIDCPLPVSITGQGWDFLDVAYVTGYDRSTTSDITCSMYRTEFDGSMSPHSPMTAKTSGSAAGPMQMEFRPPPLTIPLNQASFLRCELPGVEAGAYSHLTTIWVYSTVVPVN